jgi:hypothetical protein
MRVPWIWSVATIVAAAVGAACILWVFAPTAPSGRSGGESRTTAWGNVAASQKNDEASTEGGLVVAIRELKGELENSRRTLHDDLAAIHAALENRPAGQQGNETEEAGTARTRKNEWETAVREAEARAVAQDVVSYRAMLTDQLVCEEQGLESADTNAEQLQEANAMLEKTKKMLEELGKVESREDLQRWQHKSGLGPPPPR